MVLEKYCNEDESVRRTNNKNKRRKIDETWLSVDCNEIKIYFTCIITAQVKKPTIQMNWCKRAVIETPTFKKRYY